MTLEEIYQHHASFVWRTLRRLGVAEDDAADAVQDVFLTIHGHLHQFEGRSSITTWIFTICRTVARQRRQQQQRSRELVSTGLVEDEIDLRSDVGRTTEHRERLGRLQAILERLPPEQRNVFILFEVELLTGEEVAEALNVPLGTVYSRLELARKVFRQALSRDDAHERFALARAQGES